MLLMLISGFFCFLICREIFHRFVPPKGYERPNSDIFVPYVLILTVLAVGFAYKPVRIWSFERFLTNKARILSESSMANVHCNSVADTLFDPNVFASGHANFETGRIVFAHSWCEHLMDHLSNPKKPTREGIFSVQLFAHEAMHIRGERNEAKTECQALQRYAQAAILLGVPEHIAKKNGMAYYLGDYQGRATQGTMSSQYYSDQCAPGKALDEKLPDSTWNVN